MRTKVIEAWEKRCSSCSMSRFAMIMTRQAPTDGRSHEVWFSRGESPRAAYILADAPDGKPSVLLIATGSEVSLCVDNL